MVRRLLYILAPLMGVLVCVSFIRSINNAGEISLHSILVDLQGFDFSFDSIRELIDFFSTGAFKDDFVSWDPALTGVDGFFINIKNVVTSFFVTIASILKVVLRGSWRLLVEFVTLVGDILGLVLGVLGFI